MAEALRAGIHVDVDSMNPHGTLRDELQWLVLEYLVTTIWLIISWSDPTHEPEFGKLDNYKVRG